MPTGGRDSMNSISTVDQRRSTSFRITCSVMLEQDGNLLLVQEADPAFYGKWNQPAGHLDPGETVFECALRETKEETGYEAQLTALQAIYFSIVGEQQTMNFCFRAQPLGPPGAFDHEEILATRWFSPQELRQMPRHHLRHRLTERRIEDWLRGLSSPLPTIVYLEPILAQLHPG